MWIIQNYPVGQYECRFTQVASVDLGLLISTLDTYVQLRVVVPERDGQSEISSGIMSLPFLPAFHIHVNEIHLNNLQSLTSIRVSAIDRVLQDIKVSMLWLSRWQSSQNL